jgi:hypothetical protein
MLPEGVARHWKMKRCLGFQISLMSFPIQLMRLAFHLFLYDKYTAFL